MTESTAKSVYVLQGADSYLRDEHRQRIVQLALGDADPQLCLRTFEGDATLVEVLDELRTLPFLAPHRVVMVRNADPFVSANRGPLERYLKAPASSGTLVLEVESWNRSTKLAKLLASQGDLGEVLLCQCAEGENLGRWVQDYVAKAGASIERGAAEMLAQGVGANFSMLANEIDKLITYVSTGPSARPIATADVAAIASTTATPEAFAIVGAIMAGDSARALQHLAAALQTRGAEFPLLGQLSWHLRRALLAQSLLASGQQMFAALKAANVWRDKEPFQAMLRRRSLSQLQADTRKLLAADLHLKSGGTAKAVLQQLLIELCA